MLRDVVQRLLPNPVERLFDRGNRLRLLFGLYRDGKLVAGSNRGNLPLERGHQPFLDEEFRSQLEEQGSHLGKAGLSQGARIPKDRLESGRVRPADALSRCNVKRDRIEGLRHRVVKLASQTLPFLYRPELRPLECNGQLIGADPDEQPVVAGGKIITSHPGYDDARQRPRRPDRRRGETHRGARRVDRGRDGKNFRGGEGSQRTGNVRRRQVASPRIEADSFDQGSGFTRGGQSRVDEVHAQRPKERVRETLDDDLWRLAEPDGGKRGQGNEITEIATEFGGVVRRGPQFSPAGSRPRSSWSNRSGGTKNGFSWRVPPMIAIGWVRRTSITRPAPNCVRS